MYVGITSRTVGKRLAEHARTKSWWGEVDPSRTRVNEIAGGQRVTERHAELVEAGVIAQFLEGGHPLKNVVRLENGYPVSAMRRSGELPRLVQVVVGSVFVFGPWLLLLAGLTAFVFAAAVIAA